MMDKTYTYKELLELHITLPQYNHLHADFHKYYSGLLTALEQLFDVKIDLPKRDSAREWTLDVLFKNIIKQLQFSGVSGVWLEGGPVFSLMDLAKENPERKATLQAYEEVREREKEIRQSYRKLLYHLFDISYGKTDLTFTSQDLLRVGFDDSKQPQMSDYDDFYL